MLVVNFLCLLCQVYSPPAEEVLACEVCQQYLSVPPSSFYCVFAPKGLNAFSVMDLVHKAVDTHMKHPTYCQDHVSGCKSSYLQECCL